MTRHDLKVHPQFWRALKHDAKPFCIRRDDRHFRVGDRCVLREYDPAGIGYTSEPSIERQITFVLKHEDFEVGLKPGFVVLGFGLMDVRDDGR